MGVVDAVRSGFGSHVHGRGHVVVEVVVVLVVGVNVVIWQHGLRSLLQRPHQRSKDGAVEAKPAENLKKYLKV